MHAANAPIKIVLVEDDVQYREFLSQELVAYENVTVVFETGSEAQARDWLVGNDGWDRCVVDIFLGNGSGMALLSVLRRRGRQKKVFVLSSFLSPLNTRIAVNLKANAVFDKLTQIQDLLRACTDSES